MYDRRLSQFLCGELHPATGDHAWIARVPLELFYAPRLAAIASARLTCSAGPSFRRPSILSQIGET
jgi:hypothetical protein